MSDSNHFDSRDIPRNTAALIVAAGGARRMGSPKALLPWLGSSLLRRIAEVAIDSPCNPIHVVLGCSAEALEPSLAGLDLAITKNVRWSSGMGSSIAAGISELPEHCEGVVLLLCDQPFTTPELIADLLEARTRGNTAMAACRYADTLGPPAYFAASEFTRLKSLRGDRGAKSLLLAEPERVTAVDFARGVIDIDTPEDYDRALALLAGSATPEGTDFDE